MNLSSPQSNIAAGAEDYARRVVVWDIRTGSQTQSLAYPPGTPANNGAAAVYFSADARYLAIVPPTGNPRILDVHSWKQVAELASLEQAGCRGLGAYVTSVGFSPDGQLFASALEQTTVSLPPAAMPPEPLPKRPRGMGTFGIAPMIPHKLPKPPADVPARSAISFSRSGPIKFFDTVTGNLVATLAGHEGGTKSIAFSPDGKVFASASESGEIKLWDLSALKEIRSIHGSPSSIFGLSFSPDGTLLASVSMDGSASLWDTENGSPVATLVSLNDGRDWLILTPDGLFDGSPVAWREMLWRFGGNTFDVASIEMFFNEYFYPGLLADIMAGKRPHAPSKIEDKDRRIPHLSIERSDRAGSSPVELRDLKLKISMGDAPAGAQDLRLFRNGSLVKAWHGDLLEGKSSTTLEATLPVSAGENRITAYAFNASNVKSEDAVLTVVGAESLRRKGHVFVLAVGIDQYANPDYNLKFASADASAFADAIKNNQEKSSAFDGVTVVRIADSQATRENILSSLRDLAQRVPV